MQVITTTSQLGHILSGRRKALKVSQQTIATKLTISQNRLSELEEDPAKLTLDKLIALVNLLGLELIIQEKAAPPSKNAIEW